MSQPKHDSTPEQLISEAIEAFEAWLEKSRTAKTWEEIDLIGGCFRPSKFQAKEQT